MACGQLLPSPVLDPFGPCRIGRASHCLLCFCQAGWGGTISLPMSRVHDALRKAERLPQQAAAPAAARPTGGSPVALETPPEEPLVESESSIESGETGADAEAAKKPRRPRFPRLRRWLKFFGIHAANAPVPRCSGINRRGVPCRAPAMANGMCHAHGGSRHGKLEQQAHDLWQRVSHHPNESGAVH